MGTNRCTREEEEEESGLTWQTSPERRNLDPGETINSSLQWSSEGLRASGAPAGHKCGEMFPFVFRVSGASGEDGSHRHWKLFANLSNVGQRHCLRRAIEKKKTQSSTRATGVSASPPRPPACVSGFPQPW